MDSIDDIDNDMMDVIQEVLKDNDRCAAMKCDRCGYIAFYIPTVTKDELLDESDDIIYSVSAYFFDIGWIEIDNEDVCPSCREENDAVVR